MTRNRMAFFLCSAAVILCLLSGTLLGAVSDGDGEDDSLYKHLAVFTEVLSLVRQAYVDSPDLDALIAGALDGTTDALDPFSLYVPPDQVEAYEKARQVGIRNSGLTLLMERGVAYVVAVDPGSPAEAADVEAGDLVTEVGGRSTRVMPLWVVEEALAGKAGTQVVLGLLRRGEEKTATFILAAFDPPSASLDTADGVPILRIPGFLPEARGQVRGLLAEVAAAGHDRLLLDLRGVAGGQPQVAYAIADLFADGDLGALSAKGVEIETFRGETEPLWHGSLVVLVTRGTLGAAEVLAEVLRQRVGAELVGEDTFGWAGRQDWAELPSGGRLYFTDAFYSAPDGEPLDDGLRPDLRVNRASFDERDRPLDELILERAVERVNDLATATETEPERVAA